MWHCTITSACEGQGSSPVSRSIFPSVAPSGQILFPKCIGRTKIMYSGMFLSSPVTCKKISNLYAFCLQKGFVFCITIQFHVRGQRYLINWVPWTDRQKPTSSIVSFLKSLQVDDPESESFIYNISKPLRAFLQWKVVVIQGQTKLSVTNKYETLMFLISNIIKIIVAVQFSKQKWTLWRFLDIKRINLIVDVQERNVNNNSVRSMYKNNRPGVKDLCGIYLCP